jgi:hypothetical protein
VTGGGRVALEEGEEGVPVERQEADSLDGAYRRRAPTPVEEGDLPEERAMAQDRQLDVAAAFVPATRPDSTMNISPPGSPSRNTCSPA